MMHAVVGGECRRLCEAANGTRGSQLASVGMPSHGGGGRGRPRGGDGCHMRAAIALGRGLAWGMSMAPRLCGVCWLAGLRAT